MKPPSFEYACPRSLGEALALVGEHGADAKVLAGGQSLVPLLNLRLAEPRVLVDLNRVSGLDFVRPESGGVRIGAMTRHRTLEGSREAEAAEPLVCRAAAAIGHLAIRNRGTIGGSLAHADPAAEWPLVAVTVDARVTLRSTRGERSLPAGDFFLGPLTTAAAPDEILTDVAIPAAAPGSGFGFRELTRRPGDFAVVAVACRVLVEGGACTRAALAVGGAHEVPLRLAEAERTLVGCRGEEGGVRAAAEASAKAVDPGSDVHGSAQYRRRMVAVLVRRALEDAFAAAGAGR